MAAGLSAVLLAMPASARAQHITVTDEAGDASGPGLDITSVNFASHDHAILVTLRFTRDKVGKVIVAVKTRDGLAAVVVSKHYRRGPDHTSSLIGTACAGPTSTWDRAAAMLRLRLPASCVLDGNYGAVKSWALIEGLHDGADVDYAPQRRNATIAFTDWIPRG